MIFTQILSLLQLAPAILQLIAAIQQIFGPGNGAVKKAVLMSAVTASGVPVDMNPLISAFVDNTITALNSTKPAAAVKP